MGFIAWSHSGVFESDNPEAYFNSLLELASNPFATCGEMRFTEESGTMIYESFDGRYRIYKDSDDYIYLFERIV